MYGIIEVPEPFYDYNKKDKAAVAARWASKIAASADVEAEKTASKQKAVQHAKADEAAVKAVAAAKAAAKAAKRAAKKTKSTEKAGEDPISIKDIQVAPTHTALQTHLYGPCTSATTQTALMAPAP
mgnify:CR=1 FL=1